MSKVQKAQYALLHFKEDNSTMVKRTDVVEWTDYGKTTGWVNFNGEEHLGKALFFHGTFVTIIFSQYVCYIFSRYVCYIIFSRYVCYIILAVCNVVPYKFIRAEK